MNETAGQGKSATLNKSGAQPDQEKMSTMNALDQQASTQSESAPDNFWSHLFSFDRPFPSAHLGQQRSSLPTTTASSIWLSALKSMKLSSLWDGLGATPNFKFLAILIGAGVWIFVVMWLRQHEEDVNRMIGCEVKGSAVDQTPGRTMTYQDSLGQEMARMRTEEAAVFNSAGPGQALSADRSNEKRFGMPAGELFNDRLGLSSLSAPSSEITGRERTPYQLPVILKESASSYCPAYNVQISTVNGPRLKTIATR